MSQRKEFSPAFRLVADCAVWPLAEPDLARVRQSAMAVREWGRVEHIARRHRVSSLVWNALKTAGFEAPKPVAQQLAGNAAVSALKAGGWRDLTLEAHAALQVADIPLLSIKGVTLSQLVFGDLALRHMRDIDLLVREADLDPALEQLKALGWRPLSPQPPPHERAAWLRYEKNLELIRDDGRVLELHWRLTNNPYLLAGVTADSPAQFVDLGDGSQVPTLRQDLLLIYLCVHGAVHGWMRLKWLADVAALLRPLTAHQRLGLIRQARALGAGTAVLSAIAVCDDVFGQPSLSPPPGRRVAALATVARDSLTAGGETTELADLPGNLDRIQLSHFRLADHPRALVFEAQRRLYSGADRQAVRLPAGLAWTYPAVRIASLLGRRLARWWKPRPESRLGRWLALGPQDRLLLLDAWVSLAFASLAVRALPFRKVVQLTGNRASKTEPRAQEPARIAWAIRAAARRWPLPTRCYDQGLAGHWLLRRRGEPSCLHYGVRKGPSGLEAHVWLTTADRPVLGCDIASGYEELARFPQT